MPTLDPSEFSVFAGPGLFAIFNLNSRTALDLHYGDPKPDTAFEGWSFGDSYDVTNPHQLFQIASVGEGKYILINQKTGSYVAAKGDSEGEAVKSQVGHAETASVHWRIRLVEGTVNTYWFDSVKYQGNVLEIKDAERKDGTPVICHTQSDSREGQKWLLKKRN